MLEFVILIIAVLVVGYFVFSGKTIKKVWGKMTGPQGPPGGDTGEDEKQTQIYVPTLLEGRYYGTWCSTVARRLWEPKVLGSSPRVPTMAL